MRSLASGYTGNGCVIPRARHKMAASYWRPQLYGAYGNPDHLKVLITLYAAQVDGKNYEVHYGELATSASCSETRQSSLLHAAIPCCALCCSGTRDKVPFLLSNKASHVLSCATAHRACVLYTSVSTTNPIKPIL